MNTVTIAVPPAHRGEGSFEKLYRRAREVSGADARPLGGNRLSVPAEDAAAILSAFPAAADEGRYVEARSAAPDVDDLPDGRRKAHQPTGAGAQPEQQERQEQPEQPAAGREGGAPDVDDLPDGERAAHTPTGAAAQPEHPSPTRARRGPARQEG